MMKRLVAPLALLAMLATPVLAQDKPKADKMKMEKEKMEMDHMGDPASDLTPLIGQYGGWLVKGAEQMPAADYAWKPTPVVRSFGELVGHAANSNFAICAGIKGDKTMSKPDYEKVTDKAALVQAMKESVAYCETVHAWGKAHHHDMVDLFGMKGSVTWGLAFNIAHNAEHYGNMVTYMRMKGMTPPSSQGN